MRASYPKILEKPLAASIAGHRTACINAMYVQVVPSSERASLAGRYTLGYDLPGLDCGTGCTGVTNGRARSSFDAAFFLEPLPYQRSSLAHEAAHAFGSCTWPTTRPPRVNEIVGVCTQQAATLAMAMAMAMAQI